MIKHLLSILLLAISCAAYAADPATIVVIRTKSADLPVGTTITVDTVASYTLDEVQRDGQKIHATQRSETPANGYMQFKLVAGAKGTVVPKEYRFAFPVKLPAAPPGTVGFLRFRTHYEIACMPDAGKACISYEHETTFSNVVKGALPAVVERCLNLTGLGAPQGIRIGIGSCTPQEESTFPREPAH